MRVCMYMCAHACVYLSICRQGEGGGGGSGEDTKHCLIFDKQ